MENPYPSFEFETEVQKGGSIALPRFLSARLKPGTPLTVRITEGTVPRSLKQRSITESDIEHIASVQMEQRESVLRFLRAEGALAANMAFVKRIAARNKQRP